ncbi:hypothetical protein FPV67DRAFT_1672066 [Lyophyllum atratum]|nr:hypothetical protein FPV67DRAFT_1672066 [Lyophyllum atratum]
MANTVIVDDRDYSKLSFGRGWYLGGTSSEFDGSTTGTRRAGAHAAFTFSGVSSGSTVAVYGTVAPATDGPPHISTYSIDGGSPVTYTAVPGSGVQYKQRFFRSPELAEGQHTLVITSTVPGTSFWLDYFEITEVTTTKGAPDRPPPSDTLTATLTKQETTTQVSNADVNTLTTMINTETSSTVPPTQTTGENTSITTSHNTSDAVKEVGGVSSTTDTDVQVGGSVTATNSGVHVVASDSEVPVGVIVGAVVGALGIILLSAIIFLLFRRHRRKTANSTWSPLKKADTSVTPFTSVSPASAPAMVGREFVNPFRKLEVTKPKPPGGIGYGYVVHGGTYSEKRGLHDPQPSTLHFNATYSSQGPLDTEQKAVQASYASPYGGVAPLISHSSAGEMPFHSQPARPALRSSFEQLYPASHTTGSLYHRDQEETPPAYYNSPLPMPS